MEPTTTKKVFSTPTTLRLKEFTIESFAKFNKEAIVELEMHGITVPAKLSETITVPDGCNVIVSLGDGGVGKTSFIEFMEYALGGEICRNAENITDKTIKGSVVFEGDDIKYTVKISKGGFDVIAEGHGLNGSQKKPKTLLQNIVGNIGLNPMVLKEKDGKGQIKWLRDIAKWSDEQIGFEKDLKAKRTKVYDERTEVGRTKLSAEKLLLASGYFTNDSENKTLVPNEAYHTNRTELADFTGGKSEIDAKLKEVTARYNTYQTAPERVAQRVREIANLQSENDYIEKEIEELKRRILAKRQTIKTNQIKAIEIQALVTIGEGYIEDNKGIVDEYNEAYKNLSDFGAKTIEKKKLENLDAQHKEYANCDQKWIELTDIIDKYDNLKKELIKSITPQIEGFEIVIGDAIDNGKEEGLYYFGNTMGMLCETEIWDMFLKIMEVYNIKAVFLENINSYGSKFIDTLNYLAKEKGTLIFYSLMERNMDTLKLEFRYDVKK